MFLEGTKLPGLGEFCSLTISRFTDLGNFCFSSGGKSYILNYHATQTKLQLLAIHEPRTMYQVLSITMSRDAKNKDLEKNINHILNHIIDQNT